MSNIYINYRNKLIWKCKICDNIWKTSFSNIKNNNSGCPKCNQIQS